MSADIKWRTAGQPSWLQSAPLAVLQTPYRGTNLDVRTGDYATAGLSKLALVDRNSYYIYGYVEETKLSKLRIGDCLTTTRDTSPLSLDYAFRFELRDGVPSVSPTP